MTKSADDMDAVRAAWAAARDAANAAARAVKTDRGRILEGGRS